MYTHLSFFGKKIRYKNVHFSQFLRSPHKNNPAWIASIVLKKIYFHGIFVLPKKTINFTRSYAFAQEAKFYTLKLLKNQNLMHSKAAKLATL